MKPPPQLKTGIWIDALIRRAHAGGAFAVLSRRGDRDAGSVLVGVRSADGLSLYAPEREMDGRRIWRAQRTDASGLASTIASRADFDPDLNVVEIDDAQGRHFIEEPVLDSEECREDAAVAAAAARALFRDR
ncbi:DUF1491 family protein [uncultured Algimonas sp.]|uniref:DUF1491 family protein n=1 Tax=uncultured Algimonas sp. TaxID=1547920 RepID=UPI0026057B99|nr:DUF1491 family protein [uncultured Algimonas sp.]